MSGSNSMYCHLHVYKHQKYLYLQEKFANCGFPNKSKSSWKQWNLNSLWNILFLSIPDGNYDLGTSFDRQTADQVLRNDHRPRRKSASRPRDHLQCYCISLNDTQDAVIAPIWIRIIYIWAVQFHILVSYCWIISSELYYSDDWPMKVAFRE